MKKRLCIALVGVTACAWGEKPETTSRAAATSGPVAPKLLFGEVAANALSASQRAYLNTLKSESSGPVDLVYDADAQSVLSVSLNWSSGLGTTEDSAFLFVKRFQALLDPQIDHKDYVLGSTKTECGGLVVVLDRHLFGKQVIGSRITLHFEEGALVWVNNSVAPVPGVLKTPDPDLVDSRPPLGLLTGQVPVSAAKRIAVLAPMPDGSGVYEVDLATWFYDGRYRGALALGDTAMSEEIDAAAQGAGRLGASGALPWYTPGEGTELPSQISYRDVGGVRVSMFDYERNPLEAAYRFLESHPTLMRTGAARCQYTPLRLTEDPNLPGVYVARLQQRHGPLPVFGAEVLIRLEGVNLVMNVTARALEKIEVQLSPSLSKGDAIAFADAHLYSGVLSDPNQEAFYGMSMDMEPIAKLVVFPRFLDRDPDEESRITRLAWRVDRGFFTLIVDAHTGDIAWNASHAAFGDDIVRDGNSGGIQDYFSYTTVEVNGVPVAGAPMPNPDVRPGQGGVPASTAIGNFRTNMDRIGWRSLFGNGNGDYTINTNVALNFGCGVRGFFDPIITNSSFLCLGEAADDVIGHELTHGVLWHAARLWFADEAGAIAEAYGDLMGNLAESLAGFDWRVGEDATLGVMRNMSAPVVPHYSLYRRRPATGCVFPWDCDSGFVHTNNGIINLAHVNLSDGVAGSFTGIGRERLLTLAGRVMTQELPSMPTMHQVAGLTRDVCDMFAARGVTTLPSGLGFTPVHCDAVTQAFLGVGLHPGLTSGWAEPALGFEGRDTFFPASTTGVPPLTPGMCPITNINLEHNFLGTTLFADFSPATALGPRTAVADFIATTAFDFTGAPIGPLGPAPLGLPIMTHSVLWSSVYGIRPSYVTNIQVPTPAVCTPVVEQERPSAIFTAGWDVGVPTGSLNVLWGANPVASACPLIRAPTLELMDADGFTRIAGPGPNIEHTVTHWFVFVPVNFTARAQVLTAPSGAGGDLSGFINMGWDIGRTVRVRWNYPFVPAVPNCPTM